MPLWVAVLALAAGSLVSCTRSKPEGETIAVTAGLCPTPRGRPPTQIHYEEGQPAFKVDFDRFTGAGNCIWCHPKIVKAWSEKEPFHAKALEALSAEERKKAAE